MTAPTGLPLVLCGPIVRRVDPTSVTVFVALRAECTVTLTASRVRDGAFRVPTVDGSPASHAFYWQVTAVRADLKPLAVEVPA